MLPEGWKLSCLGDACSGALQTGPFGSQLHAHEYIEHGVSVLMPKDLINYRANIETAAKISIEKSQELKRHQLKFGDILFSRRGDVARLALIDDNSKESLCGTGCLRARPSTKIFSGFLFFFLQLPTIKSWLEHNAVGQTMPNMNTAILYELPLILPPLPEQKKIATILSTWDRAIEETEKLLANSQQQKKALMQQLLTGKKRLPGFTGEWFHLPFKKVAEIIYGKAFPEKPPAHNTVYPVYGTGGIISYSNEYLFEGPSIIIGRKGTIDTPRYVNTPFWCIDTTFYCKSIHNNDVKFLYYSICFVKLRRYVEASGVPSLSRDTIYSIPLMLPPSLSEQKAIAAVLSTADDEITAIEADLSRLRQEKKALMQQLLTGKRRVKVD